MCDGRTAMDKNSVILAIACAGDGVTRRSEIKLRRLVRSDLTQVSRKQNSLSKPYYCSNFFGGVQFEKVNPHSLNPYGFCDALRKLLCNGQRISSL